MRLLVATFAKVINALERGAWNAALDVPAGVEYGGGLKEEAQQVG